MSSSGSGRIPTSFLSSQSVSLLQTNMRKLADIREELASGQRVNRPSDDPVAWTRILDLQNTLKFNDRYMSNVDDALSEVQITDSVLQQTVDLVQRSVELATQGANASINTQGRLAIAQEVDLMIDQVVQLGNTNVGGNYIFSGKWTDIPPFARTGDTVAYTGMPTTQNVQRKVEISRGIQISINLDGDSVMGSVTTAAGPPPTVTGGSGLLRTLVQLKLDLQADNPTAIRQRLDELHTSLANVQSGSSQIGAITNRLSATQSRLEQNKATLTQNFAALQEVDLPKAITDLKYQQSIYDASMGVTARTIQRTIMDYL
jgi:flagellar hook-associated protein 3 FlgL